MSHTITQQLPVPAANKPSLAPSGLLMDAARRDGHAIAALNFYNAETLLAHIRAANSMRSSIILQTTESTIKHLGLSMIVAMARAAAEEMEQPVALHLDHGGSFELAVRCLEAGYSSLMIDGSKLGFEENCALTRRVVELAKREGVSVEGELGHVAHNDDFAAEDFSKFFTRPADAARFVAQTGVDALAVAIGTAHGYYKGEVRLDLDLLTQIRKAVGDNVSLVLHGGSGVPDEMLVRAINCGITKINFGTELKAAFTSALRKTLMETDEIDPRKTFGPAIRALEEVSARKIRLCGLATL